MKKTIGIGVLFLSIISCGYLFQLENDEKLAKKIETELNSENGAVDFAKMTDFDWDSLIILGPYTTIENVEDEFNLNLANIRQNGIHYSDYYDLIVFLKDKKSVKIIELNRALSSQRRIIKKEESKFKTGEDGIIKLTE
ncbi:hypothetical protein [Psychroflexus lacisalsi]|jgi:hypothetical protein|uniref:Uncharacterized protein n=1 Tax=Psychroflexus lacisalsi TaxID=503928 RepID=A0ABN1K0Q2_9FLAO|nr:hypothetical protein [Psychroflexus lacisalsi]MBZ9620878.1 hypothetical protein [Psychroflexus lacisalsi]